MAVLTKIDGVAFSDQNDSPILLEGETVHALTLNRRLVEDIRAIYLAGYPVVLLNPTLQHVRQLHTLIGEGITYRLASATPLQSYSLRRAGGVSTAVMLFSPPRSTDTGPSQRIDLLADSNGQDMAQRRHAVDRTVGELKRLPEVGTPPVHDPNQPSAWQDNPVNTTTLAINDESGVYNTKVYVYALHSCLDGTDHYVVTALADWTPTEAHFETAESENGDLHIDPYGNNFRVNWHQNGLDPDGADACGSPGFYSYANQHLCRYVNYPPDYRLTMVPPSSGTITQINAAPSGSQGETSTYTSGFQFNIGGTVNVSGTGPGAGVSAGATWVNTTSTTVPPLQVNAGNTGNEGAFWSFQYCTNGAESDGSSCTSHVQTNNGCRNRFGSNGGANPQNGQTPNGKFSNAVQSVHWQAGADTRVAPLTSM